MEKLGNIVILPTGKTPHVEFNHRTGQMVLEGRSIPENAESFYLPIQSWIREYLKSPCQSTNLHLKLEYLNAASMLWIAKAIRVFIKNDHQGKTFIIHLYFNYDGYDPEETNEFKDILKSLITKYANPRLQIDILTHIISFESKAADSNFDTAPGTTLYTTKLN